MRKILVAEDDLASRELIREILEARGYEVVEVGDGQEAVQKIAEKKPDLVLLDIQMPLLDGFGVLRQLRQDSRFASLPVVAVTSYAMGGDREKALAAGFDAYLTKPLNAAALKKQLEQLLGEKKGAT
ncbi:MAG: response regulator [Acidobacteria bacterium]|nr:response regulator [Acidobacteriota bacterium]